MTRRTFAGGMLAAAAGGAAEARMDGDGMLRIGEQREFVLGLYDLPKLPDAWEQAAAAGFRVAHVEPRRELLAEARRHGMYGWVTVGSIDPARRAASQARIGRIVRQLKDDPGLLFWETEDEPSYQWNKPGARVTPERITLTRRYVESLDRSHLFYLNHSPTNLVETLREYNDGAEIIAMDIYPVIPHGIRTQYALWADGRQGDLLNNTLSQVGQYADKMRQVAGPSRALWMVLQGFAWENLRKTDRDPKMVLYPDRAQLRFMSWQSIVHGATGLLFWGLPHNPPDAPLWADLQAVAAEMKGLRAELSAEAAKVEIRARYFDTGHSLDRGLEWRAKPSGEGGLLLAVVNADPNAVEAEMAGLEAFARCEDALGLGAAPRFAGGKLRVSMPPFGVGVYRLRR